MKNDKFQENLSRPGIIDAKVRYRAAARRLRNTTLDLPQLTPATSASVFPNVECFWFKNSKLSAWIQFLLSEEVTHPPQSSYFDHFDYVCFLVKGTLHLILHIPLSLTLRLIMSYIYGAPSKARNANVVHILTYVWQR